PEVFEQWRTLDLFDLKDEGTYESLAFKPVFIGSTAPIIEKSLRGDVIACKLSGPTAKKLSPLTLSRTNAFPGDVVWLLGNPNEGARQIARARVVEYDDTFFHYQFEGSIEIAGTAGAPVLNRRGELVGIQGGHVTTRVPQQGVATNVSCFIDRLR
ncbi:MAG: serine protease, partial [Planctomycetota bacterium]